MDKNSKEWLNSAQDDQDAIFELQKNPTDDKSYKELAAEAAVERYEKKSKNQVPSKLTKEQINEYKKRWGMEDIHTIDDILLRLKEKR